MSEKRRDRRGRVLRPGEQQRKDGRYLFAYKNKEGKNKFVYSWKLEPADKAPAGKRDGLSLREMEKQIQKALEQETAYQGGGITVLELVEKYISLKTGVRHNTKAGYRFVVNIIAKEEFGKKRIDTVKLSDAKAWLVKLQKEDGRGYSAIHSIRGVVRPAFQMAVEDDLLMKNPFQFELKTVVVNDSVTREAITHEEKKRFLEFIKNDSHYSRYYDAVYILFYTGMRISEFCGLTVGDIDFREGMVHIRRQLQRTRDMHYLIEETKTDAGTRSIPAGSEVMECFQNIVRNRKKIKEDPEVDGCRGFLFLDKENKPMVALHWEKYFQHAVEKHNRIYKQQLPKITPHVCRHTYCSHMAGAGVNPKTLQYLMGHSDISVTLNTYTHVDMENVKNEVRKIGSV